MSLLLVVLVVMGVYHLRSPAAVAAVSAVQVLVLRRVAEAVVVLLLEFLI